MLDIDFYKREGLNLIPLKPHDPERSPIAESEKEKDIEKQPIVKWKNRKATDAEMDIFYENAVKGKNNLGVVCGAISDYLFVIDFDREDLYHRFFPKTDDLVVVKTGRGYHVYFKADHSVKTLKIYDKEKKEVMTLKGESSYVVAPPSIHSTGKHYEFLQCGNIPRIGEDPRQRIIERAREIGLMPIEKGMKIDIQALLKGVPEGDRDNSLIQLIHWLRYANVGMETVLERCKAWNKLNTPPLSDTDVEYKVNYHYQLEEPYHYFYSHDPRHWAISENLKLINKKKGVKGEHKITQEDECYAYMKEGSDEAINYKAFSDALIEKYHFKTFNDTEEILYYKDGYYHLGGAALVKNESERTFGELITVHGTNEILGHVIRSTYIDREEVNKDPMLLNFKNGLYNLKTFEFTEHTPEVILTTLLPVKYDPDAKCPMIEQFLGEIVDGEDVQLLKEIPGYCLYRRYFIRKAVMLVGGGGNGKSTYLNLLRAFLGGNYSAVSLQGLVSNKFSTASLFGKLANIYPDLSPNSLKDTGRFKILTGNDAVDGEKKFKECFSFDNFAKLIFSANTVPISYDSTKAFFGRWIIINFPYEFKEDEANGDDVKKADKKILDNLTTPGELSGFLNLALKGLESLLENDKFSYKKTGEEVEEEYLKLSNAVYGFVHEWCEIGMDVQITKGDLYNGYVCYCKSKKQQSVTDNKFNREIPRVTTVVEARPTIDGSRQRVWRGVKLKDYIKEVQEVQDVHEKSLLSSNLARGKNKRIEDVKEDNAINFNLKGKNGGHGGHGGQASGVESNKMPKNQIETIKNFMTEVQKISDQNKEIEYYKTTIICKKLKIEYPDEFFNHLIQDGFLERAGIDKFKILKEIVDNTETDQKNGTVPVDEILQKNKKKGSKKVGS